MCQMSRKSGSLNLLEPSGSHRACNGTTLPLLLPLYVKCRYYCPILNKIQFSGQSFEKYSNVNFIQIRPVGGELWTDGQKEGRTDGQK
jgi:hypothetical protein